MFEAFQKYVNALHDAVMKAPDILTAVGKIADEANDVAKYAEPQFERLDVMQKAKAVMNMSANMKIVTSMPGQIQEAIEELKADLEQVKDSGMEIKNNAMSFKDNGGKCSTKNITKPLECYREIYGPIKYTREQRTAWEAAMKERFKAKNATFNPANYPTTDMIQ